MKLLLYPLIFHEIITRPVKKFAVTVNFELTVFELTMPDLYSREALCFVYHLPLLSVIVLGQGVRGEFLST